VLLLSTSAASFRNGTDLTPEQPAVVSFCEVLIAREGQRWNRPRLFPSLFKLLRSDTPTTLQPDAQGTDSGAPKLAHVRQPRTTW